MLIDKYGRTLNYLRISVTDRCNLRCRYCMPEHGVDFIPHEEILTFDEIVRLVSIMAGMGISNVRLTGGEPTVRKGIANLAADIKSIEGIKKLGITTNGTTLCSMADELLASGVDWINISLDTMDSSRYKLLTKKDELSQVINGLNRVLELPFSSVKINCVLSPYSIAEDFISVAALARDFNVDVRFIEWMPMGGEKANAITADSALVLLEQKYGKLFPSVHKQGAGPAQYYSVSGFKGKLGMIPAISHNFCSECNRLRLTSTGKLKLCLFYETGLSLKDMLRNGASDKEISLAITHCVNSKPLRHMGVPKHSEHDAESSNTPAGMNTIGG